MCGHLWTRMRERWRCPRVVLWQGSHSIACPQVTRLDWTAKFSVHCSFADFANLCPLTRASADVAVSSTALAIISLRALFRSVWVAEVSRWRWPWHASAEKVEQGFQTMSWSETWTCRRFQAWMALEVVAEGWTLFRGAQLAIDVTLVSALRGDGTARAGSATRPGAALKVARRRKERTCPELAGEGGRARLIVLAGKVGGRWSAETASFLTSIITVQRHVCLDHGWHE